MAFNGGLAEDEEAFMPAWLPFDEADQLFLSLGTTHTFTPSAHCAIKTDAATRIALALSLSIAGSPVRVRSHYRSDKLALWNHRIEDIISAAEDLPSTPRSRDEVFSRLGAGTVAQHDPEEDGDDDEEDEGLPEDDRRSVTAGIDDALLLRYVIVIGFLLLLANAVGCACVVFGRLRVRQRENRLAMRLQRLSTAGVLSPAEAAALREGQRANEENQRHEEDNRRRSAERESCKIISTYHVLYC